MRRHSHVPGYEELGGERGNGAVANGAPGRMAGGRDDDSNGLRHSSLIKGSNAELWDTLLEGGGPQASWGTARIMPGWRVAAMMQCMMLGTKAVAAVDGARPCHKSAQQLSMPAPWHIGSLQAVAGAAARRWMHIDQAGNPTPVEVCWL